MQRPTAMPCALKPAAWRMREGLGQAKRLARQRSVATSQTIALHALSGDHDGCLA